MHNALKRFSLIIFFLSFSSMAAYLPPAHSKHGMVVTSQHLATEVGVEILRQGGNAIDAAVAVGYALAVVHPCCGNLGGGGFMTIHRSNGKDVFINFRERAPKNIKSTLFLDASGNVDREKALRSYLAVGIPGTVMGLNTALKKYGTMSLQKILQPAIRLAREGFVLQSGDIKIIRDSEKYFQKNSEAAQIYLPNGKQLQVGDRLRQAQLAKVLTDIGEQGSDVFYRGWIAKAIVEASQKNQGVLSLDDFNQYRVTVSEPIACDYRGYRVVTGPPPSSGTTVCEILNIVSGYPLSQLGFHGASSVHYNAAAMRYAFEDRNRYLGDPTFVRVPVKKLLSEQHIKNIRNHILPNAASPSVKQQKNISLKHTTHYSIMDEKGNAVSTTITLNSFFGNKKMAPKTGFFLNNELDDFTLAAGHTNQFGLKQGRANLIAPNKQPLSSMSPTILLKNNKAVMVVGAAGGSTIITSIVQAIENRIDFKMNINASVNSPRFHMQGVPNKIFMEPRVFSPDTMNVLRSMGYVLQPGSVWGSQYWGQVAAIYYDPLQNIFYGANDNRYPAGLAAGY